MAVDQCRRGVKRYKRFLHRQQRGNTCAVAAVRTVLHRQFRVSVPEASLVALATTPRWPILERGSGTTEIRRMVRGASTAFNSGPPWTLTARRHGTLKQLQNAVRAGRWPLVIVYLPAEEAHHTLVILDVTADHVTYFDPDPTTVPGVVTLPREAFKDRWVDPLDGMTWWAVINGGILRDD